MSNFTWCYTWSDLDKGHKLMLMSDEYLKHVPYLKEQLKKGDIVTVVCIHTVDGANETVVKIDGGAEFTIKRNHLDYFYAKM